MSFDTTVLSARWILYFKFFFTFLSDLFNLFVKIGDKTLIITRTSIFTWIAGLVSAFPLLAYKRWALIVLKFLSLVVHHLATLVKFIPHHITKLRRRD